MTQSETMWCEFMNARCSPEQIKQASIDCLRVLMTDYIIEYSEDDEAMEKLRVLLNEMKDLSW